MQTPRRLLVVKNRALGDAVISLGTLAYLKSILPQTELIYLTPRWVEPLFCGGQTAADRVEGFQLRSWKDWIHGWKQIRGLQPDAIFEMSQAGRTHSFFKLYSRLTGVPYVAHNHHLKTGPVLDQGVQKPIIQRDLDGAWTFFGRERKLPIPNYLEWAPRFTNSARARQRRLIVGVVATRQTKMYPLEKYAAVAKLVKDRWPEYQIVAPLSQSPADRAIEAQLRELTSLIEPVHLPLEKLADYFLESTAYFGNDTGLKHIAVAAGLPTLTLFGPEPPLEWHPYDFRRHPFFYRDPLPCRYETGHHYCPLAVCDSMICLNQFEPEAIVQEIASWVSR